MTDERMRLICMICASVSSMLWLILLVIRGKKYRPVIMAAGRKGIFNYLTSTLLQIGFNVIDLFHIKGKGNMWKKIKKWIAANHGEKYVDYYFLTILAGQIASVITILPIGFTLVAVLADKLVILVISFLVAAFVGSPIYDEWKMYQEKNDELLSGFPQVVSKLTLLMCSGMPVRECWRRVAESGNGVIYNEMKITLEELGNGVTEIDAYRNFGRRCDVKEISKFSSMLIQSMQKGSGELTGFMRELTGEMWTIKKAEARKQGDKAATKLVFPTTLIFVGILVLILVPAMLQIQI